MANSESDSASGGCPRAEQLKSIGQQYYGGIVDDAEKPPRATQQVYCKYIWYQDVSEQALQTGAGGRWKQISHCYQSK